MCDLRDAEELKSKVFWVHQICINQRDDKEKGHVVALMRQIYTHARRVITYLGPAGLEEEEKRGIRLLKRICGNISDGTWHRMHEAGSLERFRDMILDGGIQLEQVPPDLNLAGDKSCDENETSRRYVEQGWEWLVHVAYGEWAQRLWMVQEQLLNREITTLRGHRLIEWDAITVIPILLATGYLPQQYRDIGRKKLGENLVPWVEVEQTLYGVWWDRRARLEPGTSYTWSPLLHNLQWYRSLQCGDARDRVYAILAISKDAEELGLQPDYSPLNTADVLSKQLSIGVLTNAFNLELLSFALSWDRSNSNLPSWRLPLDGPVSVNMSENIPFEVYTPHPEPYGCCLARFNMNDSTLVLKGRILDYVSTPSSSIAKLHDGTGNTS